MTASITMIVLFNINTHNVIQNQLINHANNILAYIEKNPIKENHPINLNIDSSQSMLYQVWNDTNELYSRSLFAGDQSLSEFEKKFVGSRKFEKIIVNNKPYQFYTVTTNIEGELLTLFVAADLTETIKSQQLMIISIILIDLIGATFSYFVGQYAIKRHLKPLQTVINTPIQDFGFNNLLIRYPMPKNAHPDIKDLINSLNKGLDHIQEMFEGQKDFITTVSHELRTPLTVLKGNLGLIRLTQKADSESLLVMEKEIDRLSRLVGDLLLMVQSRSREELIEFRSFNLDELLFEVYHQLKTLGEGNHNIELKEIEQVEIVGDRDRLKQVFLNLGHNAIKFSPKDTPIRLGLKQKESEVCVSFMDFGIGISKSDLPKIFYPAFKASKKDNNRLSDVGFGIGLSVPDWIIKQHKGRITVTSSLGKGTTFYVHLPLSVKS